MIKIEKTETYGWESAIRGMRNPRCSWESSDSNRFVTPKEDNDGNFSNTYEFIIGLADMCLMKRLVKSGTDDCSRVMRMINVSADITAPMYWWNEYDSYKQDMVEQLVAVVPSIIKNELSLDDFSNEILDESIKMEVANSNGDTIKGLNVVMTAKSAMETLISMLNVYREEYLKTNDKKWLRQITSLLPLSYNQLRTVSLNYKVIRDMYNDNKSNNSDEWKMFCKWVESLPYSELLTGKDS